MMNHNQRRMVRTYGTLLGRILMGGMFAHAGFSKLVGIAGTAGYIASAGLPMPEVLAVLSGVVELAAGAALILGFRMGYATAALIVFTLLTILFFHMPSTWATNPIQMVMFGKNFALIGGLLYMMAYGAGDGWALGKKKATGVQM